MPRNQASQPQTTQKRHRWVGRKGKETSKSESSSDGGGLGRGAVSGSICGEAIGKDCACARRLGDGGGEDAFTAATIVNQRLARIRGMQRELALRWPARLRKRKLPLTLAGGLIVSSTLRPGATSMACAYEPFQYTRTRCVGVLFPVADLTSAATNVGSEIIEKCSIAEKSIFWELTVWVVSILSGSKAAHPLTQLDGSVRACQNSQSETFEFSLFAPTVGLREPHTAVRHIQYRTLPTSRETPAVSTPLLAGGGWRQRQRPLAL